MTDRYNTLTVVLERDIRDDDAEYIINAIKMIKGVADVSGNIADNDFYAAQVRVRRDITDKIWEVLK
jgi:hypothetical protein